ncbi:SpoIIE family protein phosphatase [Streptomyces sp. H10-C2]|uniref:SpoIIE family protein phosphatase n=1 Tax=unclassified Streptomyces TaxID=2593676 RepID=UPI0024BB4120|nr:MULTISPECIES: SpoIIE family protein phosphatase [unclassified Streptomyces]MDJ0340262.1 SpoIIE family protein phosphatase [Streptomyces sp. PH10-H1]MDJ0368290.1 SpoIIE family protein phosphatase [Streptomyces sp. H10-C2]
MSADPAAENGNAAGSGVAAAAPLATTGVAALLRLAVLCVDPDGRVSYWNRGAEELFGHRWEGVFGHRASGLLTASGAPHQDTLDLLDDLTHPAWAGSLDTTDRDGTVRDVLWWTYRIMEPAGRSLLAIAANAKPLRTGSLRIALGDRLLTYAAEEPVREGISVSAQLAPVPDLAHARHLTARLGIVLPRVSPGRLDRIMRQVVPLGYPVLRVDGSTELPVLPREYEADGGTLRQIRTNRRELLPAPRSGTGPAGVACTGGARTGAEGLSAVPAVPIFATPAPGHILDEQLALLRETGTKVGSTLDLDTTARELCAVTVPRFADFAAILIVDQLFSDTEPPKDDRPSDTVLLRRVAVAHRGPPGSWDSAVPEGELITLSADDITPRLGEPLLVPVIEPALAQDLALDLGIPALGPMLPGRSMVVVPLTARGTVLGRMCFLRQPNRRPFDAKDAATAVEIVTRGAVHLDNARLHRFESRAAATLQRSMMPTRPPKIPGVRIAHHYMPGDRQAQVGGDWFDAIQLPGGRVALIVGDVMGHGLLSAAVMGQFRTSVITMAALDLPPAQLLRHLDNLAHRLGPEHLATCVYAVYDPIHRNLTLANAGHIPPVLARHDGRSELLQIPQGAPIGVGGVPFETVEIPVPDGSWLVLCTDGLVEVRGQGIDAGLAALCANVIEPQQTPEDVCAQILSRLHSDDRRDDVALLVARFEGIASEDVVQWTLRMDLSEVRTARELTRHQLGVWGLERLMDVTELLVSELVTNALRAASHEVQLRLMRVGKLLVEVSDDDHNLPHLRRADADDEEGRGLALVSHLSRHWGTSRKAVGKVVWFELPLPG